MIRKARHDRAAIYRALVEVAVDGLHEKFQRWTEFAVTDEFFFP